MYFGASRYGRWISGGTSVLLLVSALGFVTTAQAQDDSNRAKRRTPIVEAYERARASIVNISATEVVQQFRTTIFGEFYPIPVTAERQSVGSGFVIHPDGYIATNAHVASAAARLIVTFEDGTEYEAQIIGRDVERDLAVIKIEPGHPLKPITFGRSDDLMIGEQTIAIGNPVGLQNTVTTGVVSALHREVQVGGQLVYRDVIQTDASINPGNSGGPLLNVLGELIGVNTAVRTDAQNIGFAIPVEQLREVLPDVLDIEKVKKTQAGLKVSVADPPRVIEVREDSPAQQAGIKLGDVLQTLDGAPLDRGVDFYVALLEREAGDKVDVRLLRDGKPVETKLALTEVPKPEGKQLALRHFGLNLEESSGRLTNRLGGAGVTVLGVEPNSPAARADIRPGDTLIYLGRYRVKDLDHVGLLLRGLQGGEPVDVTFWRLGGRRILEGEARLYAR